MVFEAFDWVMRHRAQTWNGLQASQNAVIYSDSQCHKLHVSCNYKTTHFSTVNLVKTKQGHHSLRGSFEIIPTCTAVARERAHGTPG